MTLRLTVTHHKHRPGWAARLWIGPRRFIDVSWYHYKKPTF